MGNGADGWPRGAACADVAPTATVAATATAVSPAARASVRRGVTAECSECMRVQSLREVGRRECRSGCQRWRIVQARRSFGCPTRVYQLKAGYTDDAGFVTSFT
ncbi:Uncharacterised protein [Mycobacteroides abscessus subsp. abscessus]|nr:Uncharacterised protein [Mycobacteroides abscessus subsp. abscessus]